MRVTLVHNVRRRGLWVGPRNLSNQLTLFNQGICPIKEFVLRRDAAVLDAILLRPGHCPLRLRPPTMTRRSRFLLTKLVPRVRVRSAGGIVCEVAKAVLAV